MQVDEEDSSEVWAGFRVARRASPFGLSVEHRPEGLRVTCAHDGYRRLLGRVVHRRAWQLDRQGLTVTDSLEGSFREATARFHVHPGVGRTAEGMLLTGDGQCARFRVSGGEAREVASLWHPRFGDSIENRCLAVRFAGRELTTRFEWA